MNAFAAGRRAEAVLAVTDGLLHRLSARELAGVLAHELTHVQHNDIGVMGVADVVSRLTSLLSLVGQALVLIDLPLILFSDRAMPWLALLVLLSAPTLSALLQLALSRSREFDADLGAVRLTGDPTGLACALEKLDYYPSGRWGHIFPPGRRTPPPSLLRSHPATQERIRRLRALAEEERGSASLREADANALTGEIAGEIARHTPAHQRPTVLAGQAGTLQPVNPLRCAAGARSPPHPRRSQ
jgi:heat shock protein HtpX